MLTFSGVSPSDVLGFISAFYASSQLADRSHAVDRPFQEKAWSWLTRHPEVSVGKNRERNHLSLADVEPVRSNVTDTSNIDSASHDASHAEERKPAVSEPESLRVYVSMERTWLAITGHEPDDTKVPPSEFALLSIIASSKSKGITQPELVVRSGQDKRSVPKRTDDLQQKGYIEKRPIHAKSVRTSLCTLRKFLNQPSQDIDGRPASDEMVDITSFIKQLFDILREHTIISRADLKSAMGIYEKKRMRTLTRTICKFERIGALHRVRAHSQYTRNENVFQRCVKLIRDPSPRDLELFHAYSESSLTDALQDEDADLDETHEDPELDDAAARAFSGEGDMTGKEEKSARVVPIWTPDRTISNQIFDMIDRAGTRGITLLVGFKHPHHELS